ncbi:hypothetical protein GCM10008090_16470 [Arenicella chitinivorans]|uniref:Chromosome partitioning protein ParB n=1 Tax=Arenicella chitinivorans TaxID=1329800 RepID=A0A918RQB8_9GAMM|nr:hypothetical protein [Arenicella chitinivorans]GHA07340.1 hypothetical protein GCM10008090_16470 [Arenicella chitinivorans]
MQTKHSIIRSFLLTATLAGATMSMHASAASACKGLESKACGSNSACTWVDGYERKDGRKVNAFCRTSPSAKKASKAATEKAKKSTAKKAS